LNSADGQNLQNRFNRSKFVTSIDEDNEVKRRKVKNDGSLEITAWGDSTEVRGTRLPLKVTVKGNQINRLASYDEHDIKKLKSARDHHDEML
jgi:hypothetical protein